MYLSLLGTFIALIDFVLLNLQKGFSDFAVMNILKIYNVRIN